MDTVDQVPILILHVLEANITQDTSIVNEYINATEVLNSSINNGGTVLYTAVVGDRLSARGADLLNDNICSLSQVSLIPSRSFGDVHTFDDLPSPW